MKISVSVKITSKNKSIEVLSETEWIIRTNCPPREGKANKDIIQQISEYLHIPNSKVLIIKGEKSKKKLVEIINWVYFLLDDF